MKHEQEAVTLPMPDAVVRLAGDGVSELVDAFDFAGVEGWRVTLPEPASVSLRRESGVERHRVELDGAW